MGNSTSKGLGDPQVKTIVERVWNRFCSTSEGYERLDAQDLYCAILLVYNDINKKVPGPYNDPPSKEEVQEILRINDKNEDGYLDRTEFTAFIDTFLKDVSAQVTTNVLIFSFVVPTIVSLSRPKVEQLPRVGPIVKKAPPPLYSAILTTLIVFIGSRLRKHY